MTTHTQSGAAPHSSPVVECVPNFSEGADPDRVKAIIGSMCVEGVRLLDWSMNADLNRSFVTIAGPPAAVVEAAVRGAGKAAELIDLTVQEGQHPRIGAADVIPFAPVTGIRLEQCAQLAMNITDYERTPISEVFARVSKLAAKHKTAPAEGEVIGLVPEAACERDAEWMRQLIQFDPAAKILERRLENPLAWPGKNC